MITHALKVSFICAVAWAASAALDSVPANARCADNMSCKLADGGYSTPLNFSKRVLVADVTEAGPACTVATYRQNSGLGQKLIAACEVAIANPALDKRARAEAHYIKGQMLSHTVDLEAAVAPWRAAIAEDPSFMDARLSLGYLLAIGREPLSAIAVFDEMLSIEPKSAKARAGKAYAYFNAGRTTDALREAEAATADGSDDERVNIVHGRVLVTLGRRTEAIVYLERATKNFTIPPSYSLDMFQLENPWLALADTYNMNQQPAEALKTMDAYVAKFPIAVRDHELHAQRSAYYEAMGRYGEAAEALTKAIRGGAEMFREKRMRHRAELLLKAGNAKQAGRQFQNILNRGDLNGILRIQVFLKTNGYDEVEITGSNDAATAKALDHCLADRGCGESLGRRI